MATIMQMTKEELQEIIESAIERKFMELIGDPDEGLEIREELRERLVRQKQAVAEGDRGDSLEEVVQRLGLE